MKYLQHLGKENQDLIFECSRMFYEESRQLVLELFAGYAPAPDCTPLDNQDILDHLRDLAASESGASNQWERNALEITFLRSLIWDKKEENPSYHTQLVLLYCSSISSLQQSVDQLARRGRREFQPERLEEVSRSAPEEADFSSAMAGLQLLEAQRRELLVRSKRELLEFLELSNHYDASLLLEKLDSSLFLEERAVGESPRAQRRSSCQNWGSTRPLWRSSRIAWGTKRWRRRTVRRSGRLILRRPSS